MKRILNVGCGEETYGTHRMDVIRRSNVTHLGSVDKKFPFKNNYFDEVYAKQIFEHLSNPLDFLLECKRVLKKGGKLRMWTDNGNFILFVYNLGKVVHGNYCYHGRKVNKKDMHFQFFQPEHIRNYLTRAGFDLRKAKINFLKPEDYFWDDNSIKYKIIRRVFPIIFGKRFGIATIYAEAIK